jgi:hypothetical protein
MKYLCILRFIVHYLKAIVGKLSGYILTPIIYPHRDWIRNYNYNYMVVNKLPLKRSTIYKEDGEKYYTKSGWIFKRKTNKLTGKVVMRLWRYLDDDSNLTSCSSMFVKPENVKGLVHIGSYFDIGDKARDNRISIWTNWQNFKDFYYWMVIRNGYYNYNYYDEDSITNSCSGFNLPEDKRMHKRGPNEEEFSIHYFFQDTNGKWFFRTAMCKHYKGFAYGYEIGWYRTSSGTVNAKIRLEIKKPIKKGI